MFIVEHFEVFNAFVPECFEMILVDRFSVYLKPIYIVFCFQNEEQAKKHSEELSQRYAPLVEKLEMLHRNAEEQLDL